MGDNTIHYMGHVSMMGAVQPFISGAISKTVNMPEEATIEDVEDLHIEAWKLGIKAVAIYGGAPMYLAEVEHALEVFGPRLIQIYGQGETPMTITALSRADHADAYASRADATNPHQLRAPNALP